MKNKTSSKHIYLILLLISILADLAIAVIWIKPKIDTILETQTKIDDAKTQQAKLKTKLERLTVLSQNKTELLAKLTSVNIALPTQKDIPNLIIQLQKIAQESDVQIQGIQTAPGKLINETAPSTKTGPEIQLNISIKGNYEAIKTFLGKIYRAKRLINMDTITVTSPGTEDNGSLSVSLLMNAYYQPIPVRTGDESADLAELGKQEDQTYDTLQSYTSYSEENNSSSEKSSKESSPASPKPSSEARETSPSARP